MIDPTDPTEAPIADTQDGQGAPIDPPDAPESDLDAEGALEGHPGELDSGGLDPDDIAGWQEQSQSADASATPAPKPSNGHGNQTAIVPSLAGVLDRSVPRNQALGWVPFRDAGDIEGFLAKLARSELATVPRRPQFCATAGCENPSEMMQGTDGRYRPGSYCSSCARQQGTVRTIAKVQGAVERIPKRYREMTFGTERVVRYVRPELIEVARKAVDDETLSVVIAGSSGNGKSVLAAAMCNHVLSKAQIGCTARELDRASRLHWTSAPTLATARTESKFGREPEILERATRASFLVIDEFGREPGADGKDALWRIIDARHEAHRPTVFLTFLRGEELRARYDGGYIRRLFERNHSVIINLGFKKKV